MPYTYMTPASGNLVSDQTDAELIVKAQKGDAGAAGQLYDRHHLSVFRYIYARTSHRQVAEDLTGEVFTRMVRHLPKYEERGLPFRAWLYRIAGNLVKDYYRRNKNVVLPLFVAEDVKAPVTAPDKVVERALTMASVQRALATIDEVQRDVVILRFLAGLSLKEVALTLDKSVGAVKSLQHRGLAALRIALKQG